MSNARGMPGGGGGMLKLRFDRYIMLTSIFQAQFLDNFYKKTNFKEVLYLNKGHLKLTFTQRLGYYAHNCKMVYCLSHSY